MSSFLSHNEYQTPLDQFGGDTWFDQNHTTVDDPLNILLACERAAELNGRTVDHYLGMYFLKPDHAPRSHTMHTAANEQLATVKANGAKKVTAKKVTAKKGTAKNAVFKVPDGMTLVPDSAVLLGEGMKAVPNDVIVIPSKLAGRIQEMTEFSHRRQISAAVWIAMMLVETYDAMPTTDEVRFAAKVARVPEHFIFCRDDTVDFTKMKDLSEGGKELAESQDFSKRDQDTRRSLSSKQVRMVLDNSAQYLESTADRKFFAEAGFYSTLDFEMLVSETIQRVRDSRLQRERNTHAARAATEQALDKTLGDVAAEMD